jgi:hypothetical protein
MRDRAPRQARTRAAALVALAAVTLLVAVMAIYWWGGSQPAGVPEEPSDPRLAYKGPFRNIHPSVPYTGAQSCTECHVEIAASFAKHPMGRSLFPMAEASATQPPTDQARFDAHGHTLWVRREGGKTFHHVTRFDGPPSAAPHRRSLEAAPWPAIQGATHQFLRGSFSRGRP